MDPVRAGALPRVGALPQERITILVSGYPYSIQVEKHGLPVDLFDSGVVEPKMTTDDMPRLVSLIRGRQRVWLVASHNWYTDPMGLVPQTLASEMELIRTRDFYGG